MWSESWAGLVIIYKMKLVQVTAVKRKAASARQPARFALPVSQWPIAEDTPARHASKTSLEDKPGRHSWKTRQKDKPGRHSCRTILEDIPVRHSGKTLLEESPKTFAWLYFSLRPRLSFLMFIRSAHNAGTEPLRWVHLSSHGFAFVIASTREGGTSVGRKALWNPLSRSRKTSWKCW